MLHLIHRGGVCMENKIGKNIANRRKELGITQEELARRMGYKSKSTINKIELGVNDIPQTKIVKFAEVLSTTPSALMGWEKQKKDNEVIVNLVAKLRTDDEFLSLVNTLSNLSEDKLNAIKQMLVVLK